MRKIYYNNTGLRLKEIFYLILINIFSMIVCYFIIYDSISFLLEFLKNIVILELLLDTGINIHMIDNPTSSSTDVGSSSSTTGTCIPITREENDTLKSYLSDLNRSVENYLQTKNLRDYYTREGFNPLARLMQSHMNGCKVRMDNQLNRVIDYKLHLLNNKYERSDKVNEHIESLDRYSEDKAISILDE
jgi:hypothetical protein